MAADALDSPEARHERILVQGNEKRKVDCNRQNRAEKPHPYETG
jgi:hypothetical protein